MLIYINPCVIMSKNYFKITHITDIMPAVSRVIFFVSGKQPIISYTLSFYNNVILINYANFIGDYEKN